MNEMDHRHGAVCRVGNSNRADEVGVMSVIRSQGSPPSSGEPQYSWNAELRVVCEYIHELTARGPFLPYEDHELITSWLELAHVDRVLLAVDEIYSDYYRAHCSYPQNIRYIHPAMMKLLQVRTH